MGLIKDLKGDRILALGVLKSNRIEGCMLKIEKELKNKGRGSSDTRVSQSGDITVVRWLDNGIVNLTSSFAGTGNPHTVKRWKACKKPHMEVARTEAIKMYNNYMGGVNKLDFLVLLYHIDAKTKKLPVKMICHFVDFALANSQLEYRAIHRTYGTAKKDILGLLSFRESVAETLIKAFISWQTTKR